MGRGSSPWQCRHEGGLAAESRQSYKVRVRAAADAKPGVCMIALDPTLDGRRYGEWFDAVLEITR